MDGVEGVGERTRKLSAHSKGTSRKIVGGGLGKNAYVEPDN